MVQYGMERYAMIYVVVRYGMVQYGMAWYGMMQYDAIYTGIALTAFQSTPHPQKPMGVPVIYIFSQTWYCQFFFCNAVHLQRDIKSMKHVDFLL